MKWAERVPYAGCCAYAQNQPYFPSHYGEDEQKMITPATVTTVILNYRGAEDTIACLRCLYDMPSPPGRIFVVDNHSQDGSADSIFQVWQSMGKSVVSVAGDEEVETAGDAILLRLAANDGYAAGNNVGIKSALQDASCRAVWILNNDTLPKEDSLTALCDRLNSSLEIGMVGSTLVNEPTWDNIQCAGGYTFNIWLGTTKPLMGKRSLREIADVSVSEIEKSIGYICGASALIRSEVFACCGFFDEEYFLYYEDVDFGLRVRAARYSLAWAKESIVLHKEGGSTKVLLGSEKPCWVDYLSLRNRVWLIRKHYFFALPILCVSYIGVMLLRVQRGQISRVGLVWKALCDGFSGRMGKPSTFTRKALEYEKTGH